MRITLRIMVSIVLLGHVTYFSLHTPTSIPAISIFSARDWLILACVVIYGFSYFALWIYLFHHWGISEFEQRRTKNIWFWIIFLGGFLYLIGPLTYYFVVVEMRKGLSKHGKRGLWGQERALGSGLSYWCAQRRVAQSNG
jgi:hypothetical protein